jgi:hypothetical protein
VLMAIPVQRLGRDSVQTPWQLQVVKGWLLASRVHGLLQDEWQGKTRSRSKLSGGRVPPHARCCSRTHIALGGCRAGGEMCGRFTRHARVQCRRWWQCGAQPLPIAVAYAGVVAEPRASTVQDGWQRETGSRVTLRGRCAPPCAGCCARMHSRCTRLSVQGPGSDGVHTCWSRPS